MSYSYKYPRPAVTVDMLVFKKTTNGLQLLLIQRDHEPFQGFWAIPGGFMDMDETLEEAANRELAEETGLQNIAMEQLKVYSSLDRDPRHRTVSVAFVGFLTNKQQIKAGDDARQAQWFSINRLPSLAFDHAQIITDAVSIIHA